MWVEEMDVRRDPGQEVMRALRVEFAADMKARYPQSDADYGPETLPDGMFRPDGRFLVLWENSVPVGCVGLRKLPQAFADNMNLPPEVAARSSEGKSLFISPKSRGRMGAALLMRSGIQTAIEQGYEWLYGNTGANQPESVRVMRGYGELKFDEIPIYDPSNALAAYAFRLDLRSLKTF